MKKVTIENGRYEIGGGMGCWAKSMETTTINKGDVRLIGGVLMYAYRIRVASFWNFKEGRDEVWWTPVDEEFNNSQNLRNWVNNLI